MTEAIIYSDGESDIISFFVFGGASEFLDGYFISVLLSLWTVTYRLALSKINFGEHLTHSPSANPTAVRKFE